MPELNDLIGQIINVTSKNLNKYGMSMTLPSIKNSLKYLNTFKYDGESGVPKLINNNAGLFMMS